MIYYRIPNIKNTTKLYLLIFKINNKISYKSNTKAQIDNQDTKKEDNHARIRINDRAKTHRTTSLR